MPRTAKRTRKKTAPLSAPRLIRRQVRADGGVHLQVRRDAVSPWVPVCSACPRDPVAMAELDNRQAACVYPMVRALYLDVARADDLSPFADLLQPIGGEWPDGVPQVKVTVQPSVVASDREEPPLVQPIAESATRQRWGANRVQPGSAL